MATFRKRTNAKGAVSHQAQVRLKGYPPVSQSFAQLTLAKRWANQTETAILEGRYFKTTEAKKHTLADLINRYIETTLPTKPKSIETQKPQLEWWRDEIGYKMLSDITPSLLAECRDNLLVQTIKGGKTRSPASTVRYMAALSHAFTIAMNEWEWIESNPMKKVKKPKEPRGRVRFLSDEERERLFTACKESDNTLLYPVVLLALSTGMRLGEVTGIKWPDIDMNRGSIVLHETKNDERRAVPLVGKAMEVIKEHGKVRRLNSEYVFPSRNGQKPACIRTAWNNAIAKAEINDFHFHDLRHSTASYLAMNGASLAEIAAVLGHKTLAMVKRYAHLSDSHISGVLEDMNKKVT